MTSHGHALPNRANANADAAGAGANGGGNGSTVAVYTMGLRGIWYQIAQLGALGVVLVLFYQDRHAAQDQAREDRAMFRAEVSAQRAHDQGQAKALEATFTSQAKALETALRELTNEIKHWRTVGKEP